MYLDDFKLKITKMESLFNPPCQTLWHKSIAGKASKLRTNYDASKALWQSTSLSPITEEKVSEFNEELSKLRQTIDCPSPDRTLSKSDIEYQGRDIDSGSIFLSETDISALMLVKDDEVKAFTNAPKHAGHIVYYTTKALSQGCEPVWHPSLKARRDAMFKRYGAALIRLRGSSYMAEVQKSLSQANEEIYHMRSTKKCALNKADSDAKIKQQAKQVASDEAAVDRFEIYTDRLLTIEHMRVGRK
ncbi:MAG: hypothetical protein ACRCY3_04300 [Sphingorhabdus sp.]